MENLVNTAVGIDIAKSTFTAAICKADLLNDLSFSNVELFENNKTGFNKFFKWVKKNSDKNTEVIFLMEATNVYHEKLAYHLNNLKKKVVVLLPNKVNHFSKSLNVKTKTDLVDARIIARMGVERKHKLWNPPQPIFAKIKELTRLHHQLQKQKHVFRNMMTSKQSAMISSKFLNASFKSIIKNIDRQINKVEKEIEKIVKSEDWLFQKITKICTVRGLGLRSVATVIAEANGFSQFNSLKQLISFAGMDIQNHQSGTSINKKGRTSKKGNKSIRRILYFPAISAFRLNPEIRAFYDRVNKGKPSKKIGRMAVQKKLLVLIYTLYKNDLTYSPIVKKELKTQNM